MVAINVALPTKYDEITSPYGMRSGKFHDGTDFATPFNSLISVADNGLVSHIGYDDAYGLYIVVQHRGFCTLYAHLDRVLVEVGAYISVGDIIALSGNSGVSSGPHLHFEIRVGDYTDSDFWKADTEIPSKFANSVNPENYIRPKWHIQALHKAENKGWITPVTHITSDLMDKGTMLAMLDKFYINLKLELEDMLKNKL